MHEGKNDIAPFILHNSVHAGPDHELAYSVLDLAGVYSEEKNCDQREEERKGFKSRDRVRYRNAARRAVEAGAGAFDKMDFGAYAVTVGEFGVGIRLGLGNLERKLREAVAFKRDEGRYGAIYRLQYLDRIVWFSNTEDCPSRFVALQRARFGAMRREIYWHLNSHDRDRCAPRINFFADQEEEFFFRSNDGLAILELYAEQFLDEFASGFEFSPQRIMVLNLFVTICRWMILNTGNEGPNEMKRETFVLRGKVLALEEMLSVLSEEESLPVVDKVKLERTDSGGFVVNVLRRYIYQTRYAYGDYGIMDQLGDFSVVFFRNLELMINQDLRHSSGLNMREFGWNELYEALLLNEEWMAYITPRMPTEPYVGNLGSSLEERTIVRLRYIIRNTIRYLLRQRGKFAPPLPESCDLWDIGNRYSMIDIITTDWRSSDE